MGPPAGTLSAPITAPLVPPVVVDVETTDTGAPANPAPAAMADSPVLALGLEQVAAVPDADDGTGPLEVRPSRALPLQPAGVPEPEDAGATQPQSEAPPAPLSMAHVVAAVEAVL